MPPLLLPGVERRDHCGSVQQSTGESLNVGWSESPCSHTSFMPVTPDNGHGLFVKLHTLSSLDTCACTRSPAKASKVPSGATMLGSHDLIDAALRSGGMVANAVLQVFRSIACKMWVAITAPGRSGSFTPSPPGPIDPNRISKR